MLNEGPSQPNAPPIRPALRRAAATTYATTVGVAVLSLVNIVVVSRALGPSGRGDLVFVMTVAGLTTVLAALSLEEANANLVGLVPAARRALATNSVLLSLLFGFSGAVLVYAAVTLFPVLGGTASRGLLAVALAFVPVFILQGYLVMLVRADYGFTAANLAVLTGPVINVTVNGLFASLGIITVGTALGTWICGQAVAAGVLAWYVARRLAGFGRPELELARRTVGFGLKVHMSSSLSEGNLRLDHWFLGVFVGSRELGLYSVAVAWFEALFYLPTALAHVLRPDQVRASPADAQRRVTSVFRITTLATIPLMIALVIAAPSLCVIVFGEAFRGSVLPLQLLAPGAFGIVALKLMGNTLVAQRRPLLESAAIGAAFLATLILDVLLIPPFGAIGAALASAGAYTVAGVAIGAIFLRVLGGRKRDLLPGVRDLSDARMEALAAVRGLRRRTGAAAPPGE